MGRVFCTYISNNAMQFHINYNSLVILVNMAERITGS